VGSTQLSALQSLVISTIASACNTDYESVSLDANVLDLGIDSLVLVSIVNQIAADYRVALTSEQTLELFEAELLRDLISRIHSILAKSGVFETHAAS